MEEAAQIRLNSPEFENNGKIPSKFTCDGENISPELHIISAPKNAQYFAIIMEDPDVPKTIRADGIWDHWVAWNIPAKTRVVKEGEKVGVEGKNTSGGLGYTGPCPPDREHRYFFIVHAQDYALSLNEGATKKDLVKALQGHIIETAELIGRYNRE